MMWDFLLDCVVSGSLYMHAIQSYVRCLRYAGREQDSLRVLHTVAQRAGDARWAEEELSVLQALTRFVHTCRQSVVVQEVGAVVVAVVVAHVVGCHICIRPCSSAYLSTYVQGNDEGSVLLAFASSGSGRERRRHSPEATTSRPSTNTRRSVSHSSGTPQR